MNDASNSPMLSILDSDWGEYSELINKLKNWEYYPILLDKYKNLKQEALYKSHVHGLGHIERVLLFGGFIAMDEKLDKRDTEILLYCCAYHDTGRVNDFWDESHGGRSAQKLKDLTDLEGEELKIAEIAVEAHSIPDVFLDLVIENHSPKDFARTRDFCQRLKDADGLDRVRIKDLNTAFLRREHSPQYEKFAYYLFKKYREEEKSR